MLHYNAGTRHELPLQLFEQMGRYRREVFIHRMGWKLNTVDGMELDEFDGPNAVYVCSRDDEENVNGIARLLPTTAPYLMEKVFPLLWAGKELPRNPRIWELSRFAAVDLNVQPSQRQVASPQIASALLKQTLEVARRSGASTLITVSPIGMERLLRVNSFSAKRTGLPLVSWETPRLCRGGSRSLTYA